MTGRIPLMVLGGFLGAGKTTLLNHLLNNARGRRWAVLVNDFGQTNIDASLVQSQGADVISLANGCVCCQIGDDLSGALARAIGADPRPDAIVIEASGVSDPWRIAQVGLADPELALEGVVVLADVNTLREHAADPLLSDTILRQIKMADLLVLNKCDGLDSGARAGLHAWLDEVVPRTPRFETVNAKVPRALLVDVGSAWNDPGSPEGDDVHHDHDTKSGMHGAMFETWQMETPAEFFADSLRQLLKAMPIGVLRLKGLVRTDKHDAAILQFAGRHGSLRAVPQDPTPRVAISRVVAIGLKDQLPRDALAQALQACQDATATF